MKNGNGNCENVEIYKQWSIDSYKNFPIQQQPKYLNQEDLNKVLNKVNNINLHYLYIKYIK